MDRADRERLRAISKELAAWATQATACAAGRDATVRAAEAAAAEFRSRRVHVGSDDEAGWDVIPIAPTDMNLLRSVAKERQSRPSAAEATHLDHLLTSVPAALRGSKAVVGARRLLSGKAKQASGQEAVDYLVAYHTSAQLGGVPLMLQRLTPESVEAGTPVQIDPADALGAWTGLRDRLTELGTTTGVVDGRDFAGLAAGVNLMLRTLSSVSQLRSDANRDGENVRDLEVHRMLSEMPIDRLKEATRERLRVAPLRDLGITTVQSVIDQTSRLQYLNGIGETTARRLVAAARSLQQMVRDEMPVRIDIAKRGDATTRLLRSLRIWDRTRRSVREDDAVLAASLAPLAQALADTASHLLVFSSGKTSEELSSLFEVARQRGAALTDATSAALGGDPWEDFLERPADYFAMLAELGFLLEDETKIHGDLPEEIVEAVRALALKTEQLRASLRGYQAFAAKFALVQDKVIIGDEMGLGKTVEALAVLAHLRALGEQRFLVICPAAVVTNWIREVRDKSTLDAHRLHGFDRASALRNWLRGGGVAVTTFDSLGWFEGHVVPDDQISCVVVDEAHYIKRPGTLRSQRATRYIEGSERAVLLTGTPLENKLEEFRTLVSYLRPDLAVDDQQLSPLRFRRQVAPAYLRRNQEDVLTELPDLVEVDEWLPMSTSDLAAYRDAVAAGNFMAMRQATLLTCGESQKLSRLIEIVEEAEENGRKTIVFSHFRAVLEQVAQCLPGKVFGPLTGSVRADLRQQMVDEFSATESGTVLVAQIEAGGVGLNIQAASVVVITEPQVKPTTEWQAIARAHRMGQLQSVQVHRLLSDEGVDQRITEILARKRVLFAEFARVSETAESAPEAFDISEADLAREVVAAERQRLFESGDRDSPLSPPVPTTLDADDVSSAEREMPDSDPSGTVLDMPAAKATEGQIGDI